MTISPGLLLEKAKLPQIPDTSCLKASKEAVANYAAFGEEKKEELLALWLLQREQSKNLETQMASMGGRLVLRRTPVSTATPRRAKEDWRFVGFDEMLVCEGTSTQISTLLTGELQFGGRNNFSIHGVVANGVSLAVIELPAPSHSLSFFCFRSILAEGGYKIDGLLSATIGHTKPLGCNFGASFCISKNIPAKGILWHAVMCDRAAQAFGADIWQPRFLEQIRALCDELENPDLLQRFLQVKLPLNESERIILCESCGLASEERKRFLSSWNQRGLDVLVGNYTPFLPNALYLEFGAEFKPNERWQKFEERADVSRDAFQPLMETCDGRPPLDYARAKDLVSGMVSARENFFSKKDFWRKMEDVAKGYETERQKYFDRFKKR